LTLRPSFVDGLRAAGRLLRVARTMEKDLFLALPDFLFPDVIE
jgi:hypothetical protein